MTALHRTAYPRFPQQYAAHDLQAAYTPTEEELAFVRREARGSPHQFRLLVLLKVFQNLGHFPPPATIPLVVLAHIRQTGGFADDVAFDAAQDRLHQRHQIAVRAYIGVAPADAQARRVALEAVYRAAAVMDMPADLINVAIDELLKQAYELPAFSTLDRMVGRSTAAFARRWCRR